MGRVIVHLDRTPKDRSIAAILSGYQNRVRSRGISVQFSESTDSSKYESELSNLSGQLVLLDQEGVAMTSEEMADWLKSAIIDSNTTNIANSKVVKILKFGIPKASGPCGSIRLVKLVSTLLARACNIQYGGNIYKTCINKSNIYNKSKTT